MLASNNSSAGVYTAENDRSQRLEAVSTSTGAIVGASNRGPIGVATLTVDNEDHKLVFGNADARVSYMHYCAELFHKESSRLYSVRVALDYKFGGMFIETKSNFATTRNLESGFESLNEIQFQLNDILFIYAADPGAWNNEIEIVYYPDINDLSGEAFFIEVYENGSAVATEVFRCTIYDKVDGNGKQLFVEDAINKKSSLIRVALNEAHPAFEVRENPDIMNAIGSGKLIGGDNGRDIRTSDPEALAAILQAWELYEDWEFIDVNILINGGYALPAVHLKMDEIAVKRQDCIAVLDMPSDMQEATDAVDYRRNVLGFSTSHSAIYTPDIQIRDKVQGRDIYIPPSGYVASRYAYTDNAEAPWFAPGGTDRGNLSECSGVAYKYKQGHKNMLAENQINYIVAMAGNGVNIMGADTMYATASALRDIGIRRMLCFLKATVRIGQLFGVYEPNDDILRTQMRTSVEDVLLPIKRKRGLYWYQVICSRANNTNEMMDNGDLLIDVYLDPTRYAKRIHLNAIVPRTGELTTTEELLDQL